jgi:hypothetical protein
MSDLSYLEEKGLPIPKKETDFPNLTAQQLIEKIRAFYVRLEKEKHDPILNDGLAESIFLELMAYYPVSMCDYNMTESLKLTVALFYFDSKPTEKELAVENDPWKGYSFEDLALIFDRSKATIHQTIKQKEAEAKAIIQAASQRKEVQKIAMQQLIDEEKEKIKLANKETKGTNEP